MGGRKEEGEGEKGRGEGREGHRLKHCYFFPSGVGIWRLHLHPKTSH